MGLSSLFRFKDIIYNTRDDFINSHFIAEGYIRDEHSTWLHSVYYKKYGDDDNNWITRPTIMMLNALR